MLVRLLRVYLRPYAGQLGLVVILQLLATIANLALPSLNADIIDRIAPQRGDSARQHESWFRSAHELYVERRIALDDCCALQIEISRTREYQRHRPGHEIRQRVSTGTVRHGFTARIDARDDPHENVLNRASARCGRHRAGQHDVWQGLRRRGVRRTTRADDGRCTQRYGETLADRERHMQCISNFCSTDEVEDVSGQTGIAAVMCAKNPVVRVHHGCINSSKPQKESAVNSRPHSAMKLLRAHQRL